MKRNLLSSSADSEIMTALMSMTELEEAPQMEIIGGLDVHRKQITFDYIDTTTGELKTGQIRPATRERLRVWLSGFEGKKEASFALEATTGWRFVVEEIERAGL